MIIHVNALHECILTLQKNFWISNFTKLNVQQSGRFYLNRLRADNKAPYFRMLVFSLIPRLLRYSTEDKPDHRTQSVDLSTVGTSITSRPRSLYMIVPTHAARKVLVVSDHNVPDAYVHGRALCSERSLARMIWIILCSSSNGCVRRAFAWVC
jgi:hypothetical protein